MVVEKNGEKRTLRALTGTLLAILLGVLGWFFSTVIYAQMDDIKKQLACTTSHTEWSARNVYVDNQIVKLREEQSAMFKELRETRDKDMTQINQKLDNITNHLLRQKGK